MDANKKDEEIQKLKVELQQIKEANSNQLGGPSMMQVGWQFGEKFGELKKEMDGLKTEMNKMNEQFAGKNAKMDEMEKKMKEIEAKNAELEGCIVEKNEEMGKMKAEIQGLAEENGKMKSAKDEEKAKLEGCIVEKNEEMGKMKAEIQSLVEENGKMKSAMRESLEQKADKEMDANLTEKIDGMEFTQLKNSKWNAADCGPELDISEGGLVVKHLGQNRINCIRAISPISPFNLNATKPSVAGYFEVRIVHNNPEWTIQIGFCTQQFPLEGKWLGNEANSIGIFEKCGMNLDGIYKEFNAYRPLNSGDVIGVGIIHSPANKSMKCFATCNGQLLGTFELPDNFSTLKLFPAATFCSQGDSIRTNFGAEKWLFDPSKILQ